VGGEDALSRFRRQRPHSSLRFERRRSREGDRPHAFPPHFPRCLLRDGPGRPAQQEKTEAGLPQGLLKGERPQSGYPRPYKAIEVKYILSGESLKKEDVDEAVEQSMVKFCSVAATLRPGVKITYSYELLPA